MKYPFLLTLIIFTSQAHAQKQSSTPSLTDEQIIEKYLKNGAWQHGLYSPERQLYIDSAIAVNPNIAYLYQQKAMPFFKQSKYEVGMKILDKGVALDPNSHLDYRAFIKCIFAKTYSAALVDFESSKKLKGEHAYVMDHSYDFYMGLCYLQLNEFNKALLHFNKSTDHTRKTSDESWVHHLDLFYTGITYMELRQYKEAISCFDKALVNYKTFSDAKYYKVVCLGRLGQHEAADKLAVESSVDFSNGFTINEDNVIWEKYPYQVDKKNFPAKK